MMDAVTAVSGSGPAYFFLMIENLINTGILLIGPGSCAGTVVQTAKGAAGMVEVSNVGPDELRQRVTSPGGTATEAALGVFDDGDFADLVDRALVAARDRAGELSKDAP